MLSNEEIQKRLFNNNDNEKKTNNDNNQNDYIDIIELLEDKNKYNSIIKGGCLTCGGDLNIIKQKNKDSLTEQIRKTIDIIVNNNKNAEIFGSFVYRSQYYPSDIDIHEPILETIDNKEDIYTKMSNTLKKIVSDVNKKKGLYVAEIKAGLDERYNLDVKNKDFMKNIEELYNNNLFLKEEYEYIDKLYNLYINNKSCCALDELEEIIRLKKVVRWNGEEILRGYKVLPGRLKLDLIDAVKYNTSIKIDIWAPINGRYIEITNFFFLVVYDKNNDKIDILNYNITN